MSASRRDYRINPLAVLIHSERMIHFFELLISTIAYRPYVFIFFACYLFLAITHIGWRRAALFTTVAYAVAFLCEWSSAVRRRGFRSASTITSIEPAIVSCGSPACRSWIRSRSRFCLTSVGNERRCCWAV